MEAGAMKTLSMRAKAFAIALSLALVMSLGVASTALADPDDVSTRCEWGYSGYCLQVWNDGGSQHWRLYWFEGPEYCILDEA
jgi:hypothetical protein